MPSSAVQNLLAQLSDSDKLEAARILAQAINPDDLVEVMVLDLGTARTVLDPLVLGSYSCIFVASATDNSATFNLRINAKSQNVGAVPMTRKDVLSMPYPWSQAFLDNTAQSGKSVTLVCFRRGGIQSGSQVSVINGGVSIQNGSTLTRAVVTVTHLAAAVALFAADASRLNGSAFNDSGVDLYLGPDATITSAGATKGMLWASRAPLQWSNTGALFVYNGDAAIDGAITTLTEK